jgi:hypothetical protein
VSSTPNGATQYGLRSLQGLAVHDPGTRPASVPQQLPLAQSESKKQESPTAPAAHRPLTQVCVWHWLAFSQSAPLSP